MHMKGKPSEEECPVAAVAALLSDAWTMRIIHTALAGTARFCEFERALPGISTRTLTLKLKRLEDEGILIKSEAGYTVTRRGKELRKVIKAMETFGKSSQSGAIR